MKGKGIKPHIQPVRLDPPEPVKRLGERPARKVVAETALDSKLTQEHVPAESSCEPGAAGQKEGLGQEQAE